MCFCSIPAKLKLLCSFGPSMEDSLRIMFLAIVGLSLLRLGVHWIFNI